MITNISSLIGLVFDSLSGFVAVKHVRVKYIYYLQKLLIWTIIGIISKYKSQDYTRLNFHKQPLKYLTIYSNSQ